MPRVPDRFLVMNLRETYHELGEYDFKVILHPKFFKNSHDCELTLKDSDGNPMKYSLEKWGRKMNCRFIIDQSVPDGISVVSLRLKDEKGRIHESRLSCWVIKP